LAPRRHTHRALLPNPAITLPRRTCVHFGGTLLLAEYSAIEMIDLLGNYNGPYIIYTTEVFGCPWTNGSSRHIQVFKNTHFVV